MPLEVGTTDTHWKLERKNILLCFRGCRGKNKSSQEFDLCYTPLTNSTANLNYSFTYSMHVTY